MKHNESVKEDHAVKKVFESVKINHLEMKNRLVRSATWEGLAEPDGSAEAALKEDLAFARRLEIHSLPTYLVQHRDKALLLQSFSYADFTAAIRRLTENL